MQLYSTSYVEHVHNNAIEQLSLTTSINVTNQVNSLPQPPYKL